MEVYKQKAYFQVTMDNCITKDNQAFFIREPDEDDAERVLLFAKMIFASTDQVLTTSQDFNLTVEDEKGWIRNIRGNPNAHGLIAELDGEIVGLLFFIPNTRIKNQHTGEFGISVHPSFQGVGIGRQLIEALLDWAQENPFIEKVTLQVFDTNHHAIKLYERLGFEQEGRLVKAIKQLSCEYVDILQMYVEV